MTFETILYEKDEVDKFATLTINRPNKLNAMNKTVIREMDDALKTAVDLLPLNDVSAQTPIESTRLKRLLAGFRGTAPADQPALVEAILKLANMVQLYGDYLDAIELNPIAVLSEGKGICVLDAGIIHRTTYN